MAIEMTRPPRISVLMSVYNGEMYLREAVESILTQSCDDFEFIIINDASTDESAKILESFDDSRIILINNEVNLGLTSNLNRGIELAKGEFIARMDADDISLPTRFEEQIKFFSLNKEISFAGTDTTSISGDHVTSFPYTHDEIKFEMLTRNPFAHPSMMWRNGDFERKKLKYNESFRYAQDFELWTRAVLVLKAGNLNKPLLKYRDHPNRIGVINLNQSDSYTKIIQANFLDNCSICLNENDFEKHYAIFGYNFKIKRDLDFVKSVDNYMLSFYLKNVTDKIFNNKIVLKKWSSLFFGTSLYKYDMSIWRAMQASHLHENLKINQYSKLKLFIKCIIKHNP